uniref:SSD domain-containing protein n=1 Tax=Globodera pallida TaxID=36090 RepID=A0A183BLX9_GLOPA
MHKVPSCPLLVVLPPGASVPGGAPSATLRRPSSSLFVLHRRSSLIFSRMFDSTNARWGLFIAAHPVAHILISLFLVSVLSVHLINLRIEYDIRASFSPKNSKAMREESVYEQFFNLSTSPLRSFVLFSARDGGSMLRETHLREVLSLDAEVNEQMERRDSLTGMRGCDPLCSLNGPFHVVANALLAPNQSHQSANSAPLVLNYPIATYLDTELFLGGHVLGVQTANHSFTNNNSRIVSAKKIILWYFNRADTVETKMRLRKLTLKLFNEAQVEGDRLRSVKFEVFGDDIANSEMIRGAIQATILMSIGFVLLLLFVTLVIFRLLATSAVPLLSVLCVVLISILCPLLSSLAAFGLCTWMGNPLYTIMCVTPFLIAGVGVDDAFIMLQSWQHHRTIECPRRRLSFVMVHVGPSITITSLTNTIAFGIGFFTPTPQMSLFCLCTSIAVFIDYLLTFTLLCPVVVLLSSPPPAHVHLQLNLNRRPLASSDKFPSPPLTAPPVPAPVPPSPPSWVHRYALFLHSVNGQMMALFVAAILYTIGISGVLRLKSSFEPSKAFPSDSPLSSSINSLSEVFEEFFPVHVFVNRPPNISNASEYAEFNAMVSQLEALPESWGARRTLLWLRHFEQFDRRADHFWRSMGFGRHQQYLGQSANH